MLATRKKKKKKKKVSCSCLYNCSQPISFETWHDSPLLII